jgi:CheY-like chemotaxis protein
MVVLFSRDLAVLSRVEGAAARVGKSVKSATTAAQALDICNGEECDTVLIDLSSPAIDISALVGQLKSMMPPSTRTIAFGPHVHEDRLDAARRAGCDQVVSRGQFFAQLDTILIG